MEQVESTAANNDIWRQRDALNAQWLNLFEGKSEPSVGGSDVGNA